jgi:hypothetical protein
MMSPSFFNITKSILVALVVLLFAGCKSLGLDYQRPAMAIPEQFTEVSVAADNKVSPLASRCNSQASGHTLV